MPRVAESGDVIVPSGTVFPPPQTQPPAVPPQAPPAQPPAQTPAPPPIAAPSGPDLSQLDVLGKLWYYQLLKQGETMAEAFDDAMQLQAAGRSYPTGVGPSGVWPPPPGETTTPVAPDVPPDRTLDAAALTVFAGVGAFSSNRPREALDHADVLDWVALKVGEATRADADAIRAAGMRVIVWEDDPTAGQRAVDLYDADGYIGQAEGPGQFAASLGLGDGLNVPKAIVTNLFMHKWPADWVCLPEAYANVNPSATVPNVIATARNIGANAIAPVLGVYDATSEGGRDIGAAAYASGLSTVGTGNFSVFSLETMTDNDWRFLAGRTAPGAPPTAAPTAPDYVPQPTPGVLGTAGGGGSAAVPPPGVFLGGAITPQTVAKIVRANGPVSAWQQFLQVFSRRIPVVTRELNLSATALRRLK